MSRIATVLVVLIMVAPALGGGEHDKRAVKVVERAIEAMGGDAALAKIKSFKASYEGTYSMAEGGGSSPFSTEIVVRWPGDLRWSMDAGMVKGSAAMGSMSAWMSFMAPPARVRGPALTSMQEWMKHFEVLMLRPLLDRQYIVLSFEHSLEEEKGITETVIANYSSDHRYELTFFTPHLTNEALGLTTLVAVTGKMTHMDGGIGRFEMKASEPKAFGDVTLPSKTAVQFWMGGKKKESMTEELKSIEWNPEIDEAIFEMPELAMKLDETGVKEVPEHTALVIVHEGDHKKLGDSMGKIMEIVGELGLMPAGARTAVFLNDPSTVENVAELRTELRVPVMIMGPPPPALPEGVEIRKIPAAKVASVYVRAPYGTFEGTRIGALMAWVAEKGHETAGPPRIAYYHDPEGTEPMDQLADVQLPVK